MFTYAEIGQKCCCIDDESSGSETDHSPLLSRDSPPSMPRPQVYGKRKQKNNVATTTIFGTASSPNQQSPASQKQEPIEDLARGLTDLNVRGKENERLEETGSRPTRSDQKLSKSRRQRVRPQPTKRDEGDAINEQNLPKDHESRIDGTLDIFPPPTELTAKTERHMKEQHETLIERDSSSNRTDRRVRIGKNQVEEDAQPDSPARNLRSQQKLKQEIKTLDPSNFVLPLALRPKVEEKKAVGKQQIDNSSSIALPDAPESSSIKPPPDYTPDEKALLPLARSCSLDDGRTISVGTWADILPEGCTVVKLAEASYGEVYRVTIDGAESILKIMQLKVPSDEDSLSCETASYPSDVVSEIRIMNHLTECPGFVTFKAAHLVRGTPCTSLIDARNVNVKFCPAEGLSMFPNPVYFTESSVCLVIELGDAGECLEDIRIRTAEQFWDVFLGIVIGLAMAESHFEFEHRDLHENNICLKFVEPTLTDTSPDGPKYGRGGIEVTILDYGLSRAKLTKGGIVYKDLEADLTLFRGPSMMQFDTYRRMRSHLFNCDRVMRPKRWHTEESRALNNGHTWEEYIPYTNVLWLNYLLCYLLQNVKNNVTNKAEVAQLVRETTELKRLLSSSTQVLKGPFTSACDACDFAFKNGWITREMLFGNCDESSEDESIEDESSEDEEIE